MTTRVPRSSPKPPKAPRSKGSNLDINPGRNPANFALGVSRVVNMAHDASDENVEKGKEWYPQVNKAVRHHAKDLGITRRRAAGIVAAVSPGMDFDKNNINALDEIQNIRSSHWDMINASAESGTRHPEVRQMLHETAPSLSRASDSNLMKAHALLHGGDVEDVLNRRTAPKTNSFAHNIDKPKSWDKVTIDGRQYDIIADRRVGWESSRGISSADLITGTSRYEDMENVMRKAADSVGLPEGLGGRRGMRSISPSALQATTWLEGKDIERAGTTQSGRVLKKGMARTGQAYSGQSRQLSMGI